MYRIVLLYYEDRNCIRILWRWSEDKPIQEYCLNTVTYGTKSASYLATKCIQQLLLSHQGQFPDAVEKAIKGIYVDDVLTGADSADEAKQLRQELSITEALEGVPEADLEMKIPIELNEPNTIKALGIHWQPYSDEFLFSVQPPKILQPTKRIILFNIASLFDPLGLLAPIIIKAKLLMQHLWELKVDWDVIPPGELTNIWFRDELSALTGRREFSCTATVMHPSIYIRAIDDAGNNSSHLLCAKSKIAPIGNKRTTLPRLELCAAVILARLINNVASAINQLFFEIRAWVDSSVVLAWLNGGASRWKTFVANRVAEITTHLPAVNWSHIASEQNPADLISRGASPEQIQHNSLWWNGPAWSPIGEQCESTDIPTLTNTDQQHIDREQRAGAVAVSLITLYENDFLDGMMARYYPDLRMLLRVTARILRLRYPDSRSIPRLLPRELERAQTVYIRHVQQQHFREELDRLRHDGEVSSHSSLHQLKPFLDEEDN
ncbi:uncharacterized protein LOC135705561 [Ochlerotatus camptorhynchus]|uniref:uncharacterized protein LOC135705561 n=1 Tax=Ochlerotatus camptorhynchus TaxID=644619 RepID=UPI0031D4F6F9